MKAFDDAFLERRDGRGKCAFWNWPDPTSLVNKRRSEDQESFREAFWNWWDYSMFVDGDRGTVFLTECGFVGFGPEKPDPGDVVVLPYGSRHPMLLHPTSKAAFTFKGFLLVPGIMNGDLVKTLPDLELEEREFTLV